MKKWILIIVAVLVIAGVGGWFSLDKDTRNVLANVPQNADVLFWTQDQRDAAFRAMDALPMVAKSRVIASGDTIRPLPQGEALNLETDIDAYMESQRVAGLVILKDGKVVLEKYGLDFDAEGKWTSFSVAKSLTSTMVGVAIKDGHIKSLDDPVSQYIEGLKGSAYDAVTVRQILTMTSGVKWNEDYTDPNSDVAKFMGHVPEGDMDTTVSYMRQLPRAYPAGEKWEYKTGETNLIGVLVSEASGKPLSEYLSEKIWAPYGMQQDASWLLGNTGHEISGCCVQAATRDFARFGQFILDGGMIDGERVVPDDWIAMATTNQVEGVGPGRGYGFQWWTNMDGSFAAQGIFGQGIFIDPKRGLVIASNGNWNKATDYDTVGMERERFYDSVQAAIDAMAAE